MTQQSGVAKDASYLGDRALMTRQARRSTLLTQHAITTVVDVGANSGQYASSLREHGYRGRIVSFEPLRGPFTQLETQAAPDPLWACHNVGLGASEGEFEMNVADDARASSLLPWENRWTETSAERQFVSTEMVRVVRLDSIWFDLVSPTDRVWVKIDTEGYEQRVLEGAPQECPEIVVLETEMSLVPLWLGEPSFHDMVAYLARLDFVAIAIEGLTEDVASGFMTQVDGIFARSTWVAGTS